MKPTLSTAPDRCRARSPAASIVRASSSRSLIGFSHSTWMPCSSACTVCAQCRSWGVAITTISGRVRSASSKVP